MVSSSPAAGNAGDVACCGRAARRADLSDHRPFTASFRSALRETFFPDSPFRGFRAASPAKKAASVARYFIPAAGWLPAYSFSKLRYDLLAGVTIASLAIPQGISYARLAGLPPIVGLYGSFVPPLVYAVFGSSNSLAVGPVAAASLLLASIIEEAASPGADPELYIRLFYTAAFFTGVMQAALGFLRLGILVDFLSKSTITGFTGGTAILIILQQLKGMLGMKHFTTRTDIVSVVHAIFYYRHEWRWESAVVGVTLLAFLLFSKHIRTKFPKMFWLSAIAPLLVVVVGCVFAYLVNGEEHGIPIVGDLKKGLNPLSITQLTFQPPYIKTAIKAGIFSGFLALAEGISVGRSLALLKNEQIDGNKEMIAFGFMNIAGSFTSCYMTTGPFSKSAVNYSAGCKTPMSNAAMSICIMLVLLFLAPLFKYTPLVALSAIIAVAMFGLIEIKEYIHLLKVDKFDFIICMAAFWGVVLSTMVTGLSLSVGLSILRALLYVARPATCKLGRISEIDVFRDVEQYPDAETAPNILILQMGSPIYFVNAGYLKERITRWVDDEKELTGKDSKDLEYAVLDLSSVTAIDNTGIAMLMEVHRMLGRRGIKMSMVNPRLGVTQKLVASGLIGLVGEEWVFLSAKDAVAACSFTLQESPSKVELV